MKFHCVEGKKRMNFKTKLAVISGRFTQWFLQTFTNGGSSLPGKVATRINPDLLKELAKNYKVVLITGTNGKSVTTSMTVNILKQKFNHVMTNDTGSNMLQGVVSSFIQDAKNEKVEDKIAVLEVDEASLRRVTEFINPEIILVNNLFPDQMDRNGSPEDVYDLILEGIGKTPNSLIMLNGDAPILNSKSMDNKQEFFGFSLKDSNYVIEAEGNAIDSICPNCGEKLEYSSLIYSDLGDYYCPNCDFKRPKLTNTIDEIIEMTTESASFKINDYIYTIPVAGLYNIYNALAAYSIGHYFGLEESSIENGLNSMTRMFGRQEVIKVGNKDVRMNLVKNSVGLNEVINLIDLEQKEFSLIIILNDNLADGRDISWIEEGDFDKFKDMPVKETYVSGTRQDDLTNHLINNGFSTEELRPLEDAKAIVEAIKNMQTDKVYILTTYTSMLDLREEMYNQGLVKSRMKA